MPGTSDDRMCLEHWKRWYMSAECSRYGMTQRKIHYADWVRRIHAEDGRWPGGLASPVEPLPADLQN